MSQQDKKHRKHQKLWRKAERHRVRSKIKDVLKTPDADLLINNIGEKSIRVW